jgi:hypothetical protein
MQVIIKECIDLIQQVQKTHKNRPGPVKKQVVLSIIELLIKDKPVEYREGYFLFAKNVLPDLIDLIVSIAKNKELIKAFKQRCWCFQFKKHKKADATVDEILG